VIKIPDDCIFHFYLCGRPKSQWWSIIWDSKCCRNAMY